MLLFELLHLLCNAVTIEYLNWTNSMDCHLENIVMQFNYHLKFKPLKSLKWYRSHYATNIIMPLWVLSFTGTPSYLYNFRFLIFIIIALLLHYFTEALSNCRISVWSTKYLRKTLFWYFVYSRYVQNSFRSGIHCKGLDLI